MFLDNRTGVRLCGYSTSDSYASIGVSLQPPICKRWGTSGLPDDRRIATVCVRDGDSDKGLPGEPVYRLDLDLDGAAQLMKLTKLGRHMSACGHAASRWRRWFRGDDLTLARWK
jgi:hypothetical protein